MRRLRNSVSVILLVFLTGCGFSVLDVAAILVAGGGAAMEVQNTAKRRLFALYEKTGQIDKVKFDK